MDKEPLKKGGVMLCLLADLHSGSTKALFPNKEWQFQHTNHSPNDDQKDIYKHFAQCTKWIHDNRKKKKLIVVHNGDAIDGVHHGTLQIVTRSFNEQIEIHLDLMDMFLRAIGFDKSKGDMLYYTQGTESHANDAENIIGKDLGAEQNKDGWFVHEDLRLDINGKSFWFAHHGPTGGKGPNKGNALRIWLRDLYYDRIENELSPPDFVAYAHTHRTCYNTYIQNYKNTYHITRGVILPSWQYKTRFGHKVAALQQNRIGMITDDILKGGEILEPNLMLMDEKTDTIKV